MLREIEEFLDMLQLADLFWKKYIKTNLPKNKQTQNVPSIGIEDGNSNGLIGFESHPEKPKLENDAVAVLVKTVISDDAPITKDLRLKNETDWPQQKSVNRSKIEICCDICDKGKTSIVITY